MAAKAQLLDRALASRQEHADLRDKGFARTFKKKSVSLRKRVWITT